MYRQVAKTTTSTTRKTTPQPTSTGGEQSRRSDRLKPRATITSESRKDMKDAQEARDWLEGHNLAIEEEVFTTGSLAFALLQLAEGNAGDSMETLINGIRAVALCLDTLAMENLAETIANAVTNTISPVLAEVHDIVGNITQGAATEISRVVEEKVVGDAREMLKGEIAQLKEIPRPVAGWQTGRPSYASITAEATTIGTEREHQATMMKGILQRRQILLDGIQGVRTATDGLTERELVEKANLALEGMGIRGSDKPVGTKFVAAKKLRNGGVVFEMDSEKAAEWVRKKDVRGIFAESFGGSAQVKDRTFQVVVQFAPTELRGRDKEIMEAAEDSVGAGRGTIVGMKWMKNPQHWREGQRFAHLILATTNRTAANVMIREGVVINGLRLRVKKLEADPRRCFKCQFIGRGHTAENCKDSLELCGTCASSTHPTANCPVKDPAKFVCINCRHEKQKHDHASWDRMCPVFLRHKGNLVDRQPDAKYKYYPGDEEWTWVRNQGGEGTDPGFWRGNLQHRDYEERGRRDDGWGGRLGPGTMGDVRMQQARGTQGSMATQSTTAARNSQPARTTSKARNPGPAVAANTANSSSTRTQSRNRGGTRSRTSSLNRGMQDDQQAKLTDWFSSTEAERARAQMDKDLYGGSTQGSIQATQTARRGRANSEGGPPSSIQSSITQHA